MFPSLEINRDVIAYNTKKVKRILDAKNVEFMAVTKVVKGDPNLALLIKEAGIKWIGDSRLENILRLRDGDIDLNIAQIRSPQLEEVRKLVSNANAALVTELRTIKKLSIESSRIKKKFGIIVMIEMGDLREGILPTEAIRFLRESLKCRNIDFLGIGAHFGDIGGVKPTKEKLIELLEVRDDIIDKVTDVPIVSIGGTNALNLIKQGHSRGVTQLRMGEGIFLGRDSENDEDIPYLKNDAFILKAEIIELKKKPSAPYGVIGRDAFGNSPSFPDKGIRDRAILALGMQEIEPKYLIPLDRRVEVLSASSDHTLVDVTESEIPYKVGMKVEFLVRYGGLLRLMNTSSITKTYNR